MAWNVPGNNRNPRSTPPDLDEVLRQLQNKLKSLWSKRPGSPRPTLQSNKDFSTIALSFLAIVVVLLWIMSGFFIVSPSEKAAILLLGQYKGTEEPGLHWIPSLIESKTVVNVQQVLTFPYQAEMLTQDENIVSVDLVVQYRINNLPHYLFNVANPDESLQQATASALRQVIGQTTLDEVLTSGRERVRQQTTQVLEQTLARYHTGLLVMDVNMQPVRPPEQVTAAFDDAIKAREDEQRFKNQAVSYANQVVPTAQGNASRLLAEAKAYQQQITLRAQGETAQYLALLPQYQQAPQVTRERLYLEALQAVLSQTPKVLLDTGNSSNIIYLPLAQLLAKTAKSAAKIPLALSPTTPTSPEQTKRPDYTTMSAGE